MMLIPYKLETVYTRLPYANIVFIALNTLIFFFIVFEIISIEDAETLVLRDWDLGQMIGNTFLHGGLFHLIGNMIFLWVFGSAVCGTVGNGAYPFLYLFLGICASASHLMFDGRPALGASGAINGIVGMSLILFPVNRLHCWYFISLPFLGLMWKSGKFKVRAYWMIVAWVIFDILGIVLGGGNTAYWAHIGGFATGLLAGSALLYFNLTETYDPTFFDVIAGRPLERTNYDLNEIAAMPLPMTASGFDARQNAPKPSRFAVRQKQAQPIVTAALQDPNPVFHVTSIVPKGNDLMIFFVNEGDPIRNVSLVSPAGVLQPAFRLGTREMGSMRLPGLAQQSLSSLDLKISFLAGSEQTTKRMIYGEATKKFITE
jgi:membrane associated rhomboid family serine protease